MGKEAKRKKGRRAGGEKASGNTKYGPHRAPKCKLLVHEHFFLVAIGPNAAVKYLQKLRTSLEHGQLRSHPTLGSISMSLRRLYKETLEKGYPTVTPIAVQTPEQSHWRFQGQEGITVVPDFPAAVLKILQDLEVRA